MNARPHRFPMPAPDGEIIAWKCAACDEWVSEYGKDRNVTCSVDWRRKGRAKRRVFALINALWGDV